VSEFEEWLRRSLDAAVADETPPDQIMRLVRRRHTQRGIRLAASAGSAMLLLAATVPLARTWHGGGQHPAGAPGGGVLRIVAAYGPDHVDTVPAYYTADYILERAYARQLVTYRTVPDPSISSAGWQRDITVVPDLATRLPSVRNGGITSRGRVYTFHIRPGADWDTSPVRQVTAADFVREFKAFCNPAPGGFVGNLNYYSDTIAGLAGYCSAEENFFANTMKHPVTAASVAAFQNSHAISGIAAVNPLTLRFRLVKPASDFLSLLAMPFASARPAEYDRYLPNSAQLDRHLISDGPYTVGPVAIGERIVMHRNPAWRQSTDPVRHQYVREIIVTAGVTDATTQVSDLRRGRQDLMLDAGVPGNELPGLAKSPEFHIWPNANMEPYLVFNLRSPGSDHAAGRLDVRRAIEFGVNKAAIQRVFGGPSAAKLTSSVQPAGNLGHIAVNPYPSVGNQGNTVKCKADLRAAGYHSGLTLKFMRGADSVDAAVFAVVKASLSPCGIRLLDDAVPESQYYPTLGNVRQNGKPGAFDIGLASWLPDWFGNDGRTTLASLFQTHCVENTTNYGCYSNHKVDDAIVAGEQATTPAQAAREWAAAARQIMVDAAVVPLTDQQSPILSSARVREAGLRAGVVFAPNLGGPDITNLRLVKG
jgi:peptide/nickel transport system substrate-binding protein